MRATIPSYSCKHRGRFPVVGAMLVAGQPLSLTLFASDRWPFWIRCEEQSFVSGADLSTVGEPTPPKKASQNATGEIDDNEIVSKTLRQLTCYRVAMGCGCEADGTSERSYV